MRVWRPVVVALVAAAVVLAVGAASAAGSWHSPIRITSRGTVTNGWIDGHGVFRTVGDLAHRPHLTTVTSRGASRPRVSESAVYSVPLQGERTLAVEYRGSVRLTVLSPRGVRQHAYTLPGALPDRVFGFDSRSVVALANGGALVCTDLAERDGELVAVLSPGGSRIHLLRVAGARGAAALPLPDGGCFGADAAPASAPAGVIFENGDANEGSGATDAQLLLERVLPGPRLGAPIPLVPTGQAFTVNSGMPVVAETASGWVAVSWLQSFPLGDKLFSQENLRWISPTDVLGPVIRLTRPTASYPAAVSLAAFGQTGVVALINPESPDTRIYSERIDAPGRVGPRHTLFAGQKIVPPVMATSGRKVVAAWGANGSVRAAQWVDGRWSKPTVLAHCVMLPSVCPYDPGVTVSRNGHAAVYFSLKPSIPLGLGGAVAFDF
ncbi:MAG: hypothetical protein ACR2NR_02250 [Solirubrobacteraceae bacterium]